jgi:hypothetical protein
MSNVIVSDLRVLMEIITEARELKDEGSEMDEAKIFKYEMISTLSYTVKLGYNELGYNKLSVITNRFFQFFQSQIESFYIIQPCYNESRLLGTNFAGPKHVRYNRVSL